MQPLNLQKNERIVWESKPLPEFKWLLFLLTIPTLFIVGFSIIFFTFIIIFEGFHDITPATTIPIVLVSSCVFLCITYITANLSYDKEYYWITNRRIAQKSGLLGYRIYSIPFERVSDVIITRSFLESIFKFGGVQIQSFAGQGIRTFRNRFGAEGRLSGLKEPEKVQSLIFRLIEENRKNKKLSM